MQLRFNADQPYQLSAINAVAGLFAGQERIDEAAQFAFGETPVLANRLDLSNQDILRNLQLVQSQAGLAQDPDLFFIDDVASANRFPNFSVEMETGTGKTYVYLRTIMELNMRYGLRKFMIVVPSVAIREGVLHTLHALRRHFAELYDGLPVHHAVYDSGNLTRVRQFALSDSIEILVMTIDSFTRETNIIRQATDRLQGEVPIDLISRCRPIVVLDEPQNMESELRVSSISQLNPLLALRYSATHRNPYNVVYRLTPHEAYRQKLVKRIEVAGLRAEGDFGRPLLRLIAIRANKRSMQAILEARVVDRKGQSSVKRVTAQSGTDLRSETDNPDYEGYIVDEISRFNDEVTLANGVSVPLGGAVGDASDAVVEAQLRYTIEEHFRKSQRLHPQGIKVLSLFFLDRVADYADDGPVQRMFDRLFREIAPRYASWRDVAPNSVRAAYFASRRTKQGEILLDSTSGSSAHDRAAYDLIMRRKERLLQLDEPVSFIFSHSALREGWDNPNIFQICTLNHARSEMRKRQEVGRGVRLAVNQDGDRVHDERFNVLTVIAAESYEQYVARLQEEVIEEFGARQAGPPPANARSHRAARLVKERVTSEAFVELWRRISAKTRYSVTIDSEKLVAEVAASLRTQTIAAPAIMLSRAEVTVEHDDKFNTRETVSKRAFVEVTKRRAMPSVIDVVAQRLSRMEPPIRLTRRTIYAMIAGAAMYDAMLRNLDAFANAMVSMIRKAAISQIALGIKYEKTGDFYDLTQFDESVESWAELLEPVNHAIYDHVQVDSEVERRFARDLDSHADVKVFAKLPSWFAVDTPVGRYTPDWAVVAEVRDAHGSITGEMLYLIRETKGSADSDDLRAVESYRIVCAREHFAKTLHVDFKVITSIADL